MSNSEQLEQIRNGKGFIAALDQSGGSTPKALRLYGIGDDGYANDAEMFDLVHQMRTRIVKAPAFTGEKVIGAILFEKTMDSEMDGTPSGKFIWEDSGVVPFLKIDKGLEDEADGVQLMKHIDGLDALLKRGVEKGMFGTKMRSVISAASETGIAAIVAQQFDLGRQIMGHGLIPIIEPEVTITIKDKAQAEAILLAELTKQLDALPDGKDVMLKLTLPETANTYQSLVNHPRVMRVVALSGGYTRSEANTRLSANTGVIASFSRALTEGLSVQQSDVEFDEMISGTIDSIYTASVAG